ncbi:ABC transporter substrate-binding protein [Brevibacterium moorei]|uniref:ABC transporter substrate-binding protein n=1 Tax=Brevibacterium moorei TaxID=2968457 RepID=UPI00211C8F54|nr:ABC transporter substrate-binding protein [Brevibacterium sp. 68QC2CO]MCQ9385775.1 ABC transporter substrate-binding protein [Brevibacterium sp. 68QC2CO]
MILSAAVAVGLTVSLGACSGGSNEGSASGDTLVAEMNFDLKTIDPARQFELSGSRIEDTLYQTALTFADGDLKKPTDGLCSYTMSKDNKVLTLTFKEKDAKFSNGDPVTVDDIVFSYQRLQGVKGNPSFYLDGVTVKKVDDETITLTSKDPNPALPYILPNSNLGVLNAKEVKANGGTTDEKDKADQFLDSNSQGSGPYKIESYNAESKVVLAANEHYNGPEPKYKRVVINNVSADTQLSDIQSGQTQVAFDLGPDQVKTLDQSKAQVASLPSTKSVYIFANDNTKVSGITSKKDFRDAMRYAVDYDKVVEMGGEGAQRMASVVPNEFIGSVPKDQAPARDLDKAKELLTKAGYKGEEIPFHYSSDQSVNGLNLSQLAESVQAQVKEAGINLSLKPAPSSTQLDGFRSGKQPMGISTWGADFPDPTNYLVFTPGQSVSERAGWTGNADPATTKLIDAANKTAGDARGPAYQKAFESATANGPFIPLVQPVQTVVIGSSITKFVSNADTDFDFAQAE